MERTTVPQHGLLTPIEGGPIDKVDVEIDDVDDDDDGDDEDDVPQLIALDDAAAGATSSSSSSLPPPPPPRPPPPIVAVHADAAGQGALLPPCPVTILSGFLGSGKTTLVQYILRSPDHGKRIAVIENEFGEGLSVESMIARDGLDPESNSLQDLIELPNGCICCTVKDSLVETLEKLLAKRCDLDYILIEASGMANPGPIASVFWLDDALGSRLKLDGIVTLVDGVHILEQLKSTEEAAQQIAYADRIVLNKVDLLQKRETTETDDISTTESDDRIAIVEDCFGGIDRVEELERFWSSDHSGATTSGGTEHDHNHDHQHGDGKDCTDCHVATGASQTHVHSDSISTIALKHPGSIDLTKLNSWLADILWPQQDEADEVLTAMLKDPDHASTSSKNQRQDDTQRIFRIKGIISARFSDERVDETDDFVNERLAASYQDAETGLDRRRFIVQAVHDLWEVYPASDELMFSPDEERESKVIVIGKFLQETDLRLGFKRCFVE